MPRSTESSRPLRWLAIAAGIVVLAIAALWMASGVLSRMVRELIVGALKEEFASGLELKSLNVAVFPSIHVVGEDLVFRYHGRTDLPPLITIQKFTASANIFGLLRKHVSLATLQGLRIHVPPSGQRIDEINKPHGQPPDFVIGEVIADGAILTMTPNEAWKEPKVYRIERLRLQGAGPSAAMPFQASLRNATPPGDIETAGKFGPWDTDDPAGTPVSGAYTFRNADLSVFRGISGTLSSEGNYRGVLSAIAADGHTDTPDFAIDISGSPVHLTTQFHALIDGTDGDTQLQPVIARFGQSSFHAQGGVTGTKGIKGKTVSLDVTASGRLEDMLLLGVKARNPPMSGAIHFSTKFVVPPSHLRVVQKLRLDGAFEADAAHFSKLNIQDKIDELSHHGSGQPKLPASDTVASDFSGQFVLDQGVLTFRNLSFRVPGVDIRLGGTYQLDGGQMDFRGSATLQAKLSQTTTGFKSFLLKAIDPLFKKKNAGAVIPIKIGGTREKPSYGLDLKGVVAGDR